MKEQLIDFETAKLAKKKGFDWKCNRYYYSEKGNYDPTGHTYDSVNSNSCAYHDRYSAPTQSLLQKWLRGKHEVDVFVVARFGDKKTYIFYICDSPRFNTPDFETYEQALEKGLIEALKLIN